MADKDVTISISGMPEDLLREIDAIAKDDRRSRSSFIVRALKDATREAKRKSAAEPHVVKAA